MGITTGNATLDAALGYLIVFSLSFSVTTLLLLSGWAVWQFAKERR